ncbi:MAG: hypothetical protein JHC81_10200 [Brevundimonas sp.]|uniref:hypothetical protein n=1 Tax=Brevundimonas sp. TaxID=1871086 RepID=UPI001A1F512D|nr:hypothetical protein [Brevundimonas sp.]MBJ7447894.1 hypothetical protein [Brevundimonas sp.]
MLILALTSALLMPAPTDPREVALEVRTARFEQVLDAAVEAIEADIALPVRPEMRRQSIARRIAVLTPEINAYARDMTAGFAALGEGETPERAAELRQYGEGLTRYLDGLPAELTRGAEAELTGGGH